MCCFRIFQTYLGLLSLVARIIYRLPPWWCSCFYEFSWRSLPKVSPTSGPRNMIDESIVRTKLHSKQD